MLQKWLHREIPENEQKIKRIVGEIEKIHMESPDKISLKIYLNKMIEDYIDYYNNKRLQRNLGVLTPMEKHKIYLQSNIKTASSSNLLAGKIYIFSLST